MQVLYQSQDNSLVKHITYILIRLISAVFLIHVLNYINLQKIILYEDNRVAILFR